MQTMIRESSQLQIGKPNSSGGNNKARGSRANEDNGSGSNKRNGPQLQQALVGREVDDLIMEEREQDILRLNRDVALVNEMFK